MSIDWYDPELYYFLSLLAGFAALEFVLSQALPSHQGANCHQKVARDGAQSSHQKHKRQEDEAG